MSIRLADISFAHSHYDPRGDVLYLATEIHRGPPPNALETDEGHCVEFDEAGRVIGMIIVSARRWLDRDGELRITLPADDLTPQELAGLGGSPALRASEAELAPALKSAA